MRRLLFYPFMVCALLALVVLAAFPLNQNHNSPLVNLPAAKASLVVQTWPRYNSVQTTIRTDGAVYVEGRIGWQPQAIKTAAWGVGRRDYREGNTRTLVIVGQQDGGKSSPTSRLTLSWADKSYTGLQCIDDVGDGRQLVVTSSTDDITPVHQVRLVFLLNPPHTVVVSDADHCWQYHGVNKLADLDQMVGPDLFKAIEVRREHRRVFLQYMWSYFAGGFGDMNPPKPG